MTTDVDDPWTSEDLAVPIDEVRMALFLRTFGRLNVDRRHPQFRASEEHQERINRDVRQVLEGHPTTYGQHLSSFRFALVRSACRSLDIHLTDLPLWLRGMGMGPRTRVLTRFELILAEDV